MMSTNKQVLKYNRFAKQAGMTLIELTVVLLILIGLAGLLIPYVGSFTQKTHDSTNSSNLSALNGAVTRYVSEKNKLPDGLDTLVNTDPGTATLSGGCAATNAATGGARDTTIGTVYCGLLDPSMFAAVTYGAGSSDTNPSIPLLSLAKAGLTTLRDNMPEASNKTFNSGTTSNTFDGIGQGSAMDGTEVNLVTVQGLGATTAGALAGKGITVTAGSVEDHLALALGGSAKDYDNTCYDYVALGIGDGNKMVGNTIQSAPVHFPEDAALGPVDYYNHYVAIVQVDKANSGNGVNGTPCSTQTEKAKFLGVVMNVPFYPGSYLFGANQSLAYGYENNSNQ